MSTALAVKNPELSARIALSGNLSELNDGEIWEYYQSYCNYLGLDPVTRPFDILSQWVKEKDERGNEVRKEKKTLYPNSSCSAQLASKHKISYERPVYEYNEALKVVFCFVTLRFANGRSFTGESVVDKSNKSGMFLENALKKAATQARRRATLQACGIALPDESEIADIPNAQGLTYVAPETEQLTAGNLRMLPGKIELLTDTPEEAEAAKIVAERERLKEEFRKLWPKTKSPAAFDPYFEKQFKDAPISFIETALAEAQGRAQAATKAAQEQHEAEAAGQVMDAEVAESGVLAEIERHLKTLEQWMPVDKISSFVMKLTQGEDLESCGEVQLQQVASLLRNEIAEFSQGAK